MANIFLTSRCNLKCPYCFADEFVNKDNEEISAENFKFAVDFIKKGNERIGFIGGEPLLHPNFDEFMDIVITDEEVKNTIIFTNGLLIDKHLDKLIHKKVNILVNCNSPKDLGEVNFEKLKSNLLLLKENKPDGYTLGINIYSDKTDYSYIFDLLKSVNGKNVRFSTALPNTDKEQTQEVLGSFLRIKPFIIRFLRRLL